MNLLKLLWPFKKKPTKEVVMFWDMDITDQLNEIRFFLKHNWTNDIDSYTCSLQRAIKEIKDLRKEVEKYKAIVELEEELGVNK